MMMQKAVASTLSKIARFDLPLEFKELVPTLATHCIDSQSSDVTRLNALHALEAVLAEVGNKKLLPIKKFFNEVSKNHLTGLVTNIFLPSMEHFIDMGASCNNMTLQFVLAINRTIHLLLNSSLSSLVGTSFESPTISTIDEIFTLVLRYIPLVRDLKYSGNLDTQILGETESLLQELYQMVMDAQKLHPLVFLRYLIPFLNLFFSDLTEMINGNSYLSSETTIPELLFLSNVVQCSHYDPDEDSNEAMVRLRTKSKITSRGDFSIDPNQSVQGVTHNVWNVFFTQERIDQLSEIALFCMQLQPEQISDWSSDAEAFSISRAQAIADDNIIACSQHLYLALAESRKGGIIVSKKLQLAIENTDAQISCARAEALGTTHPDDRSIFAWDSIYTALGLSVHIVENWTNFNFDLWVDSCLLNCLTIIITETNDSVSDTYRED